MQAPPRRLVERYLTEIAKTYNVDYTSPPDLNPEADAIDLMLIDPPYNSSKGGTGTGGGSGTGKGGGGGGGRGMENTDWTFTPVPHPQPQQPMVSTAYYCQLLSKR